jgi:histidyl-tRNA synthetase
VNGAPALMDYLGEASRAHFDGFRQILDDLGIAYELNVRLVRGLDYYCNTVFEWVTDELGSQGTVCAGGRYDGLIEQLGGKASHAVGFAMGIERVLALVESLADVPLSRTVDAYLIRVGEQAERAGMRFAESLRTEVPELKLQVHCGGGSFKSQFKKADKSGAEFAIILGDDEVSRGEIAIKPLRLENAAESAQASMSERQAMDFFRRHYGNY